jgi:hypothetical protein
MTSRKMTSRKKTSSDKTASENTSSETWPHNNPAAYAVGYGKPPVHTQFRKGQSGNPGGRPRRTTAERAKALALKEAYRTVTVKEGGGAIALPAMQAILRSQVALAAKGHGPAQRAVIAAIQAIEKENAQTAAAESAALAAANRPTNIIDAARRVAFLLKLGEIEEEKNAEAARDAQAGGSEGAAPLERSGEAG